MHSLLLGKGAKIDMQGRYFGNSLSQHWHGDIIALHGTRAEGAEEILIMYDSLSPAERTGSPNKDISDKY